MLREPLKLGTQAAATTLILLTLEVMPMLLIRPIATHRVQKLAPGHHPVVFSAGIEGVYI